MQEKEMVAVHQAAVLNGGYDTLARDVQRDKQYFLMNMVVKMTIFLWIAKGVLFCTPMMEKRKLAWYTTIGNNETRTNDDQGRGEAVQRSEEHILPIKDELQALIYMDSH